MMTLEQLQTARRRANDFIAKAGIVVTPTEAASIEIADFGLSELDRHGLCLLTYLNTERCCAKELVIFPGQTCPEHRHPPVEGEPGKEETFRCRWGEVYLYVPGEPTASPRCAPPPAPAGAYTVFHEVVLRPGEQYTLLPNTLHWFQAGPSGAVVSEFSTRSRDDADFFSDTRIQRAPVIEG